MCFYRTLSIYECSLSMLQGDCWATSSPMLRKVIQLAVKHLTNGTKFQLIKVKDVGDTRAQPKGPRQKHLSV